MWFVPRAFLAPNVSGSAESAEMPRGGLALNEQRVEGFCVRPMSVFLIEKVPTPFPENRIKTLPGSGNLIFFEQKPYGFDGPTIFEKMIEVARQQNGNARAP